MVPYSWRPPVGLNDNSLTGHNSLSSVGIPIGKPHKCYYLKRLAFDITLFL